jgi:hypothetical protein
LPGPDHKEENATFLITKTSGESLISHIHTHSSIPTCAREKWGDLRPFKFHSDRSGKQWLSFVGTVITEFDLFVDDHGDVRLLGELEEEKNTTWSETNGRS